MDHVTLSTITIAKKKIAADQRIAAKALLLSHFPEMLNAGQLIIHFGPGRTPFWVELQERVDAQQSQLQKVS